MDRGDSRETAVAVPEGYTLVPDPQYGAMAYRDPEWIVAVPPFDPQSALDRWWSLIMRWPRRGLRTALYITLTWRRFAVVVAVVVAVVMVCRAYL